MVGVTAVTLTPVTFIIRAIVNEIISRVNLMLLFSIANNSRKYNYSKLMFDHVPEKITSNVWNSVFN